MTHRKTVSTLRKQIANNEKLSVLTCYSYPLAQIIDPLVDIILVGDSLGMTFHGLESTVAVDMEMMIMHGKAVKRGSESAFLCIDLPFGSYEASPKKAFEAAAKLLKETGFQAVKFEGGIEMAETVKFLVERGIPVMGHVGLKPQHVNVTGSYSKVKSSIAADMEAVCKAGAFAVVIENVEEKLASEACEVARKYGVITIGIGAGQGTDGQVLVLDDVIGMSDYIPPFAKDYSGIRKVVEEAVRKYVKWVKS